MSSLILHPGPRLHRYERSAQRSACVRRTKASCGPHQGGSAATSRGPGRTATSYGSRGTAAAVGVELVLR